MCRISAKVLVGFALLLVTSNFLSDRKYFTYYNNTSQTDAYNLTANLTSVHQPYNVISMSLYGADPRYTSCAIRNSELVKIIFPGWRLRFYIEGPSSHKYPKVPLDVVEKLNTSGECIKTNNSRKILGGWSCIDM